MTSQEWYLKLRSFVPSWWFEQEKYSVALFKAMSAVLHAIDEDAQDQFLTTFFTESTDPILDMHGDERGVERLSGELDVAYVPRIQGITSHTNRPDIEAYINSQLFIGPCRILEAPLDSPYMSRGTFCSRNNFLMQASLNYFIVVIPKQVHAPYAFASREYFTSRSDFMGSSDSTSNLFQSIIEGINRRKAFGVMYSVVEE